MVDMLNEKNEWLVVELRQCRAILGISQSELSEISGVAIQTIKRLEKQATNARYSTVLKLRKIFADIGLICHIDGKTNVISNQLSAELVEAINKGELKSYIKNKKDAIPKGSLD